MNKTNTLPILFITLLTAVNLGCAGWDYNPTYPTGGPYDDEFGGQGPYGGDYDDYGPDWAYEAEGEWEGFMTESYRSDHEPLGKRKVAVRIQRISSDRVGVDVVVDGHPMASSSTSIGSGGSIGLSSSKHDFSMGGSFNGGSASGSMSFTMDEKVKNPYTGETETHNVHIGGSFSLGRVRGAHWAAAWDLFDTHGEGIWDLPDEVWEVACAEGLAHLAAIEEATVRSPVTGE